MNTTGNSTDGASFTAQGISRRQALLKLLRLGAAGAGVAAVSAWLSGRSHHPVEAVVTNAKRSHTVAPDDNFPDVVIVEGGEPAQLVQAALRELGGISRFVSRNDVVLVKPNIGWDRTPEQAANTNPELVAEVVRQCLSVGARKVIVTDVSCNDARRCFQRSGIAQAARNAGAQVLLPDPAQFKDVDLEGEVLRTWQIFEPFLSADKIINIPIAKHHSLSGATLGMKNWFGMLGGMRNQLHQRIHESLVDLADFVRPSLTVVDCYRVLVRNGPTGGSLEDVALHKTLVAGTDPVAVDAYVAKRYWNLDVDAMPYLKLASQRGLGSHEFDKVKSKLVKLS
jgi:uncharacterized protein (DUF362 family)